MQHEPLWRHEAVRDLNEVLGAPSIMVASQAMPAIERAQFLAMAQNAQFWLRTLDENPKPLLKHIQATPRHNRLGLYYEALLSFCFANRINFNPNLSNIFSCLFNSDLI